MTVKREELWLCVGDPSDMDIKVLKVSRS